MQTYLRLDRAGCPVAVSEKVPDSGIVVFHSKHKRKLLNQLNRHSRPTLVGGVILKGRSATLEVHTLGEGIEGDLLARYHAGLAMLDSDMDQATVIFAELKEICPQKTVIVNSPACPRFAGKLH